MRTKKYIVIAMLALTAAFLSARTIEADQYVIWGIGDDQISIPAGSVITEAVLTIQNVSPQDTPLYIHLLDNTDQGFQVGTDAGSGDFFDSYGVVLSGAYENGNYVCRFSQIENAQSPIRATFPSPTSVTLADSSTVQLSSALLELMDYAGNGRGFGIGIDSAEIASFTFSSLTLKLTVSSYQTQAADQYLTFTYNSDSALQSAHALQFDGVDDTAIFGSYVPPSNSFTVSAWVKTDEPHQIDAQSSTGWLGTSGQKYLCHPIIKYGAGEAGMGISIGTNGVSVYEWAPGYLPALAVYNGYLGTSWNHITITYTNKQPRIYVNGTLVCTGLTSPKTTVFAPQKMGGATYGWFKGEVSGFHIWDRALSDAEVLTSLNDDSISVGLVGNWKFDEGSGTTIYDSSGNGYNGSISGATWVTLARVPETGNALRFDGVDDTAIFGSYVPPSNNFTVSAWVKTDEPHQIDAQSSTGWLGTSGQKYLCHPIIKYGAGEAGMGISIGTNGVSVYEWAPGYLPALAVYEGSIDIGWNHITITYTNKQPRIYVNGTLVCTGMTSPRTTIFAPQKMGGATYGWFKGEVSGFHIWDRALSDAEVLTSLNDDSISVGLVGNWKFDEGSGTTIYDSSGNGYNGSISGATWVACQ